jgi:Tol biopolymer transport system component
MGNDGSYPSVLYPDYVQKFAWSPDGRYIAVHKPIGPGYTYEITVMNAASGLEDTLTSNTDMDLLGSWSPDGTKIAFVSDRSGVEDVFVINVDGTGLVNLTNNPTYDGSPTWSPDGEWIAFMSDRDGNGEIYIMRADGSGLQNITNSPEWEFSPYWSP